MIPPSSRLQACCMRCNYSASRDLFYEELDGVADLFQDTCPKCLSDDVDVFDPSVSFAQMEDELDQGAYDVSREG